MFNPGVLAILSGLSAQACKVLIALLRGRWQPQLFFSNGGMPSSHSATVMTLTLEVGRREGYASSLFSLVLVFGLFVIMEATGLRQEMGQQAALLNELMDGVLNRQKVHPRRLRELVGHTWTEVLGGLIFGTGFFFLLHALCRFP
ncbi:acid phosphatase [bacterium DOLZORAL124_64_63]|nr:MAG: acid phosphatase [bacterium DOLZORAL124_64_63]